MNIINLHGVKAEKTIGCWTFETYAKKPNFFVREIPAAESFVFCVEVPGSDKSLSPYFGVLTREETRRAQRFKHEGARLQFLTAHITLHLALQQIVGEQYKEIVFRETVHHKPYIEIPGTLNPPKFNLSHCAGWVAIAIGPYPVGIDIEGHREMNDLAGIAGIVFTESERRKIFKKEGSAKTELFFRHWSCKEAYLKAEGTGFMQEPKGIEIEFDGVPAQDASVVYWSDQIPGHSLAWTERKN